MYNIKFYTAYIGHMSGNFKKVHKITWLHARIIYLTLRNMYNHLCTRLHFRQYIISYTLLCTKYCLASNVLAVTTRLSTQTPRIAITSTSVLDSKLTACLAQLDFSLTLQTVPVITRQMQTVYMVAALQH